MSRVADRLAELGLTLPPVVAPLAAYVPAVVDGGLVWTAGQLPFVDGALPATGVVGDGEGWCPRRTPPSSPGSARSTRSPRSGPSPTWTTVRRIVKVVGFVASAPGFTGQPGVVNGASELLGQVFGEAGRHARSAVGVAALPLGAPVEVEVVAALR